MSKRKKMSRAQILSAAGRINGRVRSEAKAAAARENGKLGGRPRKQAKPEVTR